MSSRLIIGKTFPEGFKVLTELDKAIKESGLDKWYQELIKISASHLNGCAFCLDKHTYDALELGIDARKITLVGVWREAENHFSEKEQLILQVTEAITLIHEKGLSEELYSKCIALFGDNDTVKIIMAATVINTWNRIGVGFKMQPKF
ncbi:carboxymuconolactone decarboxylase family protein [Flavobacterium sp. KBS0721]|uniref:carboxymuconolactone decarboxylase family protein n=1 Tax=Flavobacterium sp. KBS0721 TaxID=1179672 RepID=UPI00098F5010|nr:carboxymuconolactone decarboxylase family protein [Flavobacterium sp. KBS0721]QDW21125.1 carboxymuconolactone decarboxylase family protein [Flavobacterium sp. KBS0721]